MMNRFDRFDFEQQIMSCWNITTDLKDLNEGVIESDLSRDQISNALMGIEQLYELRFNKLFQQFETLVHEYAHTLDRDSDAIDEFNSEQIRKFHEAQQELPL
jgi:hypothetical protein